MFKKLLRLPKTVFQGLPARQSRFGDGGRCKDLRKTQNFLAVE
jgi:hypothetical protein